MPAEPLQRVMQSVAFSDSEIRRACTLASREAAAILRGLEGDGSVGARLRRAQVQLAKANADLWSNVESAVGVGIGDGVWQATEYQSLFDEGLFSAAGMTQAYWRQSMFATAAQAKQNLISRGENGIPLSRSVYRNQALSKGLVDDAINNGLLLNKTPREIAKSVVGFIDPAVPGGVSYAAMRLGRSEVVNAYHQTALRKYKETPWVERVKWNLSGSHPKPDLCNEYAEQTWQRGWPAGVMSVDDVPGKPHPQCLCYITPVPPSLDAFAKNFKAGKYDDYIEHEMGCFRGA